MRKRKSKINRKTDDTNTNPHAQLIKDVQIIKQVLIAQLIISKMSFKDIMKITGMGTTALYKFLPKNLGKIKKG